MSQYVSADYYKSSFKGTAIPDNELEKYLNLASEKIDTLTFNRIVYLGFDNLTEFQKTHIMNAICYQADYTYENGLEPSNLTSYSVLDISVSVDNKNSISAKYGASAVAYDLLEKTGLMCRSFRGW